MKYMLPQLGLALLDEGRWVYGPIVQHLDDYGRQRLDRWLFQMQTPYIALPEEMKPSDRDEADRMLEIVRLFGG